MIMTLKWTHLLISFKINTNEPVLFYICGHLFELDKTVCDRWANIEKICSVLGRRDGIWYATNGEICKYISAARYLNNCMCELNDTNYDIYILKNGKRCVWKKGTYL